MSSPTAKHLFVTPNGFEYVLLQEGLEFSWRFRPLGEAEFVPVPGPRSVLRTLLEDTSAALVYYDSALHEEYFDPEKYLQLVHLRLMRQAPELQTRQSYGAAI